MRSHRGPLHGRGAAENPPNRFETLSYVEERDEFDPEAPLPRTEFLKDASRSIIATNQSPDVGFDKSINPYRGCEHGCVYCYARPTHENLGFSAGLDFETKILVKEDAPELLRAELSKRSWKPQTIAISGVTDAYQPIERKLRITRRCLEVLAEYRNPVIIVTKNRLVARDADLLAELARYQAAAVFVSVTSLDSDLQRTMEPRTSPPALRLAAIETLAAAGVPVGVMVAPVVPAVNEHEIPAIVAAAARAGARHAGYVMLRLPFAVKDLFERWLADRFPDRKEKVLNRIRDLRDGELNDPRFGSRMRGRGAYAEEVKTLFHLACRKAGIEEGRVELSTAAFRRSGGAQLSLGIGTS